MNINYKEQTEKWRGFKEIKVTKIVEEDNLVKSFYLENEDESKLPSFIAGQYIAVKIKNEDGSFTIPRQYTLSLNSNGEFYRISVKREEEGLISKKLCDEIKVNDTLYITAPIGNFVLKDSEKPLVLIGGGIGITPMLTMAYEAVKTNRKIHLIYSTPNSKYHSFKEEIKELENNNNNLKVTTIYTRPLDCDKLGNEFQVSGRISKEYMKNNLPRNGEFYFCGPVQFMKYLYHNLIDMNINKEDINYELFAAGEDITK